MAASAPTLPTIGDTIDGKYTIIRVIAEGGMGVVYEGVHKRLDQRVAIKVLYPHYSANPDILARFDLEGRIASRLQGLNVTRVHDIDVMPNGILYMVMELLSGHDLETELQSRQQLPVSDVADIVTQAAMGMREAHALGVVHRDLKPANIFLCPIPGSHRKLVKVLDFGISRVMHDGNKRVTADFAMLGTALYMSPEQAKSAANVDARSDVWALGIIMYELLTGTPPFDGQLTEILVQVATATILSPRLIRPDIPEGLEQVIMRALERDPAKRFQSMDEVITALMPWVPEENVELLAQRIPRTPPPTVMEFERHAPGSAHKRTVIIGAGFTAAALLGFLLIGVAMREPAKAPIESSSFDGVPAAHGGPGGPAAVATVGIAQTQTQTPPEAVSIAPINPSAPPPPPPSQPEPRTSTRPRRPLPKNPTPVDSNPRRL
jgi:serine/threonine protein kinase